MEERGFTGKNILADQLNLAGEASVVVDVGAYDGAVASEYLDLFPEAVCHALEPHPPSFRALTDRLGKHPRARLHQRALGDVSTRATLHAFPTAATNSLLAPISDVASVVGPGHMDSFEPVEVDVTTLDVFASGAGFEQCFGVATLDRATAERSSPYAP